MKIKTGILLNILLIAISLFLAACAKDSGSTKTQPEFFKNYKISVDYRGWQGIAADENYVYLFTDRNEKFELENIISLYTHDGRKVREFKDIYKEKDSRGNFMSFGDGNLIDGRLYVTAYNFNS